tara:strand:- start:197 stop:661 length:465 start_codon:yes stop_codon:yes gene_type:complete
MRFIHILLIFLFISNCSLNKVVDHHGVHNLEKKQAKLKINHSNKNDIIKIIGPPSIKSTFDNDVYIYIEKKNSSSKLTKFGKKQLIKNDILVLDINKKGILIAKKFYNKEDMNSIKFDVSSTKTNYSRNSFVYNFLYSLRQKIDDPRGVKRSKK